MKVAVTANLRNGILWEAVKQLGSQAKLAEYLGVNQSRLGLWLNFRSCPDFLSPSRRDLYAEMESKLFDLTGHTLEQIFPPQIRNKQFLNRQKKLEAVVEMPVEQLAAMGAVPQLLPAPDELLFEEDRRAVLEHVINGLRPREAKVLRMRFGLAPYDQEHILDDVAAEMGVTRERCRQMEITALNRLRHPAKARELKPLQHY